MITMEQALHHDLLSGKGRFYVHATQLLKKHVGYPLVLGHCGSSKAWRCLQHSGLTSGFLEGTVQVGLDLDTRISR